MSSVNSNRPVAPATSSDSTSAAHNVNQKNADKKPQVGKDQFEAGQSSDAQFQKSVHSEILPDNGGEQSAKHHGKAHHGKTADDSIDPNDPNDPNSVANSSVLPLVTSNS